MQIESALRGTKINNFIELWCLVASGGLDICVLSTSFQKLTSAGLNSLQQKEYQISVKNGIFDDPCHKKGTGIGHLGARDDQIIRISNFFDGMRLLRSLRPWRLLRLLRSLRPLRF